MHNDRASFCFLLFFISDHHFEVVTASNYVQGKRGGVSDIDSGDGVRTDASAGILCAR